MEPTSSPRQDAGHRARAASATVAIVGGGASGVLAAVNLLRSPSATCARVMIVESAPRLGRGIAYGTTRPEHLLNVPAAGMSALADEPAHFQEWLERNGRDVLATSFVPRSLYASYLEDLLASAEAEATGGVDLERVRDRATSLSRRPDGAFRVGLASGREIVAAQVVLATGNGRPGPLCVSGPDPDSRVVQDPWDPDALARIEDAADVVLVGTGLTAVDVTLTLLGENPDRRIGAFSRHGLLPHAHRAGGADPRPGGFIEPHDGIRLASLVRTVRATSRAWEQAGRDWRDVMNAVRPITPALWAALSIEDQRRFLRHLARFWDVHRHRMAPEVAAALREHVEADRFEIVTAAVVELAPDARGVDVAWRSAAGSGVRRADAVVNCTGPSALAQVDPSGLLGRTLEEGLARLDPHGLGLETDGHGGVIGAGAVPTVGLHAIGPLQRGMLWESTAVPEIRVQASALPERIASVARL